MTVRTPNVFIVGAGPVATALAGAMRLGGVPVMGLWARRPAAARAAAAASGVASYSAAPPDILLESDVVILAVRDAAIAEVAAMLTATGLVTTRHVMLHCSGAMSAADAFANIRDQIGGIGTIHPLRAIAEGRAAMRELSGTVFGVEGDEIGKARALALVEALGGKPLALSGDQMAAYHTAAAMASNFLVTLLDAACGALDIAGIDESMALGALLPLVQGSLDNVAERGIADGLTGPIRRGDAATVSRHLDTLGDRADLARLYRTLGQRTIEIARRASAPAPASDLDAVAQVLTEGAGSGPAGRGEDSAEGSEDSDKSDIESRVYRA